MQHINSSYRSIIDQQNFRNAMSKIGASVHVITTDGIAGMAGFTASAVSSITDEPPTVLVCINRQASAYPIFKQNGHLCINTLCSDHEEISRCFGGKTPMQQRFEQGSWNTYLTGCPVLEDALVACECQIQQVVQVGSHDIFICEVLDIHMNNDEKPALMYFQRHYHSLASVSN